MLTNPSSGCSALNIGLVSSSELVGTLADLALASDTQGVNPPGDSDVDFSAVPAADDSAVPDPQFMAMRNSTNLPQTYMPPAMAGNRPPWVRAMAAVLVGVFLTAAAAGICLTYGPGL